jgi:hypothetical protein
VQAHLQKIYLTFFSRILFNPKCPKVSWGRPLLNPQLNSAYTFVMKLKNVLFVELKLKMQKKTISCKKLWSCFVPSFYFNPISSVKIFDHDWHFLFHFCFHHLYIFLVNFLFWRIWGRFSLQKITIFYQN